MLICKLEKTDKSCDRWDPVGIDNEHHVVTRGRHVGIRGRLCIQPTADRLGR
jgi:hypothetical protein